MQYRYRQAVASDAALAALLQIGLRMKFKLAPPAPERMVVAVRVIAEPKRRTWG